VTIASDVVAVAAPVRTLLARAPRRARVRAGGGAAYVELGDAVVVIVARGTVWLPNAIVVADRLPPFGGMATLTPGSISLPDWAAAWDARRAPVWDPVVIGVGPAALPALSARGRALLDVLGGAPEEVTALAGSDLDAAKAAALDLVGRGPGLTPEGDDVLVGVCVALVAAGHGRRAEALLPSRLRERTTALSATLLELAVAGAGAEPLHALLDPRSERWPAALSRLESLGSSSGRAMALGAAVGAGAAQLYSCGRSAPTSPGARHESFAAGGA
jgi:hypothetical protein